jgi:hypothetical protein
MEGADATVDAELSAVAATVAGHVPAKTGARVTTFADVDSGSGPAG